MSDRDQGAQSKVVASTEAIAPRPRVALVHDWLTGMRGGEKVLELFCRRFPDAPLWTLLHLRGKVNPTIEARRIHTSLLQRMPFAASKYRSYLPLFPLFAELHKAGRSVDVVISTSHAVAKAMVVRSGQPRPFHVCYIHTPMRYVWDMFDEYFGPQRVGRIASLLFFTPIANLLQAYDKHTVDRVDLFLANSTYVADRVRRIYGREAVVLPPPVDTKRFLSMRREPEDWYLVVSALVPYKRVDHAIRAAAALNFHLKLVGIGPETVALKRLALELKASVEFVGFVSDAALGDFYRRARALLFPGVEDFGIVPVEAIACGCPVIALGVGGVLDSMTEQTSVLYPDPTVQGLQQAILEFEARPAAFRELDLRDRAKCFSEENFLSTFEHTLQSALNPHLPTEEAAPDVVAEPDVKLFDSEKAMNFPKVSVVISNYNYADFLETSIKSVLLQTYAAHELIIVDDGSTDGSEAILQRYEGQAIVVRKKHGGETSSRNEGFLHCSGEIVAFLDADDYWRSDAIEKVVRAWDRSFSKLQFPLQVVDRLGRPTGGRMPRLPLSAGFVDHLLLTTGRYITSPTSGNFYSREFLASIFPVPEEEWPQSMDSYAATYAGFSGAIGVIQQALGYYRVHESNMTHISGDDHVQEDQLDRLMIRGRRLRSLIQKIASERHLTCDPGIVTTHWLYLKLEIARLALNPATSISKLWLPSHQMLRSIFTSSEVTILQRLELSLWLCAIVTLPVRLRMKLVQISFNLAPTNPLAKIVRSI